MNNLIIIGAGGFGREVLWLIERINHEKTTWNVLGFLDDNRILGELINNYPVLGKIDDITKYQESFFVTAIGASKTRKTVIDKIGTIFPEAKFATLIDPSVIMSECVEIGKGSIVCAGNIITVNIRIGNHVIINLDCTVGHDAQINDFVTLYPSVNVSGMTSIGYASEVGTGTQIIQGKNIGNYTIVGAGAVVVKDIPSNCTAVGIPAKPIKINE